MRSGCADFLDLPCSGPGTPPGSASPLKPLNHFLVYLVVFYLTQRFLWCTLHVSWISRVTIDSLDVLLSRLGPVCCSRRSSNCCFLTCIQVSQEAGQVVWYSHLFQNFPQYCEHKRRLYTWTSPDGQHRNQRDYILCSQRWRSSIQSAKTRLGADGGSDHELLMGKFRLKLKKVEKSTRSLNPLWLYSGSEK